MQPSLNCLLALTPGLHTLSWPGWSNFFFLWPEENKKFTQEIPTKIVPVGHEILFLKFKKCQNTLQRSEKTITG